MVDGVNDVGMRGEEAVSFDFLERLRDGLLPERTADLLQGKQF